ncbi:PHP domain-containing protein [Pseudoalteromonas sp. C2R02]|uniref:RNase RNM n=1 Tax=Pseudoalteromonas sp. C2R02 TaxID=2841565 RepID=UPI001C097F24|nr:PHP domain-containing protein [Pseudoalteromonas sp. C2R02]MBU2967916.1 PHP domain-containing protein [Pseudoalteromonas sp. C2R02]
MKYDLHSHTTCSDGRLSPEELIDRAVEKGIDIFAITDHDTLDALPIAHEHINQNNLDIKLINGIEISTRWHSFEIHIVGLNLDAQSTELLNLVSEQKQKRDARALEIGRRLEKAGIVDAYQGAKDLAGDAHITRAHFAQYLVNQGKAKNIQGVFKKYLARGKTGYTPSTWCDMKTAIEAIQAAGGQAVVAHPGRYKMSNKWLRQLLSDFKADGGDGMEVAQPQQAPTERQFLGALSREYGLLCSQGSDFHFPMTWLELGKNLYLPKDCTPVWQDWAV